MTESILNSEIFIVSISVISFVLIFYLIYKILKYFILGLFLIGVLFYFDVINKENLTDFDKKYNISKTITEKYNSLSFIKDELEKD